MKQPYASEYLKKDALKIRSRQLAGEIIVTTARGYWPLPLMSDVPGLRREGSRTVCEWGSFVTLYDPYNAAQFIPADGQLPLAWAGYTPTPIELATVVVDPVRRWARVVSDESGEEVATLTDVPAWESGWRLLEDVRTELAKALVPAVPWRVAWAAPENGEGPLWEGRSPMVRNEHAAVNLAGYAFDDDRNLIYLSAVGHKTALEAIRASLLGRHRQGKLTLGGGRYQTRLNGLERYEQVWAPLPDFQAHHVIFLARQAFKPEPADAVTYLVAFDGDAPEEQARRLLTKRLHAALPIPVLDEWAEALWNAAAERDWITAVRAAGDCRGCWQVSLMTDWAALVESLITQGEIEIAID